MIAIRLGINGGGDHAPDERPLIQVNGRAALAGSVSVNKEIAMTFKTILVHLDSGKRCAARLELGIRLAKSFDAHLVGLHALTVVRLPGYAAVEAGPRIAEEQRRRAVEYAAEAEKVFKQAVDRGGVPGAEWRSSLDDALDAVTLHARYADLVVIGQSDPDEEHGVLGVPPDLAERVVESVPRPALVIPYIGDFPVIGQRILVGWDTSRSAARAIADALPLLKRAANVTVLVINPESAGDHGELPGADISLYLARHGVKVEAMENHTRDVEPGTWIVSRAFDLGADLIVMGGFGHLRLRELVFGSVTRSVLGQTPLPVLIEN
jgi:nucleotide-binding universal stress UspA family protein